MTALRFLTQAHDELLVDRVTATRDLLRARRRAAPRIGLRFGWVTVTCDVCGLITEAQDVLEVDRCPACGKDRWVLMRGNRTSWAALLMDLLAPGADVDAMLRQRAPTPDEMGAWDGLKPDGQEASA